MSELEALCRVLSSVNDDIGRLGGHLQGQASRLRGAAAVAAAARDDEGRPPPGTHAVASQLEFAARQVAMAGALLAQAASQGRSFVQQTVGRTSGGATGLAPDTMPTGRVPLEDGTDDSTSEPDTTEELGPYFAFPDPVPLGLAAVIGSRSAQGQIGDCGLVAAVDAVRITRPALLAQGCRARADGTYTVRLQPERGPVDIEVSPSAPQNAAGSYCRGTGVPAPSVVTLYEKAIAILEGRGYAALQGFDTGLALRLITGEPYDHRMPPPTLETISAALAHGPVAVTSGAGSVPMVLGTRPWNQDVVPNHAYAVATVTEGDHPRTGVRQPLIHLVNPWGAAGREVAHGPQRADELWLSEAEFKDSFDAAYIPAAREESHD